MLLLVFIFLAILFIWMFAVEPRLFEFNRLDLKLKKVVSRPFRILHLSDIHFAPNKAYLNKFFDRLARKSFDFIFITGDIMDCEAGIPFCVENLKKLKAEKGIFAVLGNHDHYNYKFFDSFFHNFPGQGRPLEENPVHLLETALHQIGIRVLKNETVEMNLEGTPLLIHGMDDATTGKANVRKTMENFDPAKINLLLTHSIDVFFDIGKDEMDAAFAGHSHGGQIRLPFLGPIVTHTMMGRQYASGLKIIQGTQCVISRGVSASRFLFVRLLCRPEAIMITVG